MTIVLATGGFDPLHSGHINYLESAKALGDHLVVGLNSDIWLNRKKGRHFMPFEERKVILEALQCVDEVISFNDDDDTACEAIRQVLITKASSEKLIFANGGDRKSNNIPEMGFKDISFKFGVGGTLKKNSSSWILDEWVKQRTKRDWGYWEVFDELPGIKVKQLVIYPGKSLSNQRHLLRAEQWSVLKGSVLMETESNATLLTDHKSPYFIDKKVWHKASNVGDEPAHVLEIQYGEACVETDIERKH